MVNATFKIYHNREFANVVKLYSLGDLTSQ